MLPVDDSGSLLLHAATRTGDSRTRDRGTSSVRPAISASRGPARAAAWGRRCSAPRPGTSATPSPQRPS